MDASTEFWNFTCGTSEITAIRDIDKQQQIMEKKLPNGIFQLINTGSVIIDIERENG